MTDRTPYPSFKEVARRVYAAGLGGDRAALAYRAAAMLAARAADEAFEEGDTGGYEFNPHSLDSADWGGFGAALMERRRLAQEAEWYEASAAGLAR